MISEPNSNAPRHSVNAPFTSLCNPVSDASVGWCLFGCFVNTQDVVHVLFLLHRGIHNNGRPLVERGVFRALLFYLRPRTSRSKRAVLFS